MKLEKRVETIAKESCAMLEAMYPLPRTPSKSADIRSCTKTAIENTAEELQAAIAAAQ